MKLLDTLEQWRDNSENEFGRLPMPPDVYASGEIHQIELENIFKKEWICIGHISELKEAGDYLTFDLVNHPVIALRDSANEIRVYSNVCPHRSSRLLDGSGKCNVIICPYHAWAYELNGKLRGAPRMDKEKVAQVNLHPLNFEIWQGLIFVNLDDNAAPLSPRLSALDTHINKFDCANMEVVHSYEGEVDCNWKVLAENFCESYHLFKVHKTTLEPYTPTSSVEAMVGGEGYNHHTIDRIVDDEKVAAAGENKEHLSCIYPSTTFAVSHAKALWLSIIPTSYNRLRFRAWVAKDLNELNQQKFEGEEMDRLLAFMAEDKVINTGVQKGLEAGVGNRGPLHDMERTNWDFGHYYAKMMLDN